MRVFHNDQLVPLELCRLLYQTIPPEYHAPIVFHRHRDSHFPHSIGMFHPEHHLIEIFLDLIFDNAFYGKPGSLAFNLWFSLLYTCYHEFGHVATLPDCPHFALCGYDIDWHCHEAIELLADSWSARMLNELRDHDPRLAQPADLGGYLGARFCQHVQCWNRCRLYNARRWAIKEWRCRRTGVQLTAGDVLRALRIWPNEFPKCYRVLRAVSDGIGTDYVDRAGRHHRLYVWGVVPLLGTRMLAFGKLTERQRAVPPHAPMELPIDLPWDIQLIGPDEDTWVANGGDDADAA